MASICTESLHALLSYLSGIALARDGAPTTFRDVDTLYFTAVVTDVLKISVPKEWYHRGSSVRG